MDMDGGAGRGREAAVAGDVVGVVVGLEYVVDAHAEIAGELEVIVDLEPRVDHCCRAGRVVADEVRGAAEIVVRDLAEDHLPPIISRRFERAKQVASSAKNRALRGRFSVMQMGTIVYRFGFGRPQECLEDTN